ncbi:MAG: DJ-1/PfpI family protein [Pseudomonadales bacterium]|nr:DJ-1/PfpI family protein [Pseudomonadales bacterium]
MQIAIVLYKGMTALDAIGPYEVLNLIEDSELRFVSNEVGPIVTDSGILVLGATHSFEETPNPDLILVPGSSADTLTAMADKELINWLQTCHPNTRLTLSVCSGALVLAAAGLLEGKEATTHWLAQDELKRFGAIPKKQERIVRSGKIMTAAGVSAGIDLALAVVEELCGRQRAEEIQLLIEYDPQPPVNSGHISKASKSVLENATREMKAAARNPRNAVSLPLVLWRTALRKLRKH